MEIKTLKKGQAYLGYLLIKNQLVKTSAKGSRYFNMTMIDSNQDSIEAKMWDVSDADEEEFTAGKLVKVKGTVQEYNGKLQLIAARMRVANEGDSVSIENFVATAPISAKSMLAELQDTVNAFKNSDLKKITSEILNSQLETLSYFPAAKTHHHAIKGGLLYHTLSMLRIGKSLTPLYPFLNADLLYAGIILHDLGKMDEMISDENGSVSEYSKEGKLLGHIVSEITTIETYGKKLGTDGEVLMLLKHMILSHHYEAEYGSPKRPMFPEAELLHHIDIIDARMNTMERILQTVPEGGFSENQWSLEGVQLYHTTLNRP